MGVSGLNRLLSLSALSVSTLLWSESPVHAQTNNSSGADSSGGLEEVLVTATKREESVQSVPMSITAITAVQLEQAHVQDFEDIARMVPNLSYAAAGSQTGRRYALRGIYGDNTVGFYLDDLPIPANLDPRVVDLDRIEVLRGPQGTLFGARSMGGTIRMITNVPDQKKLSGEVSIDGSTLEGGTSGYQVNGTANIPLIDDVAALRATAYTGRDGAFINREFPDPNNPASLDRRKVGGDNFIGGSISALFKITDRLSIRATVLGQRDSYDGYRLSDYTPATLRQLRPFDVPESDRRPWLYTGLTVKYDTAIGNFTSATSYFHSNEDTSEDASEQIGSLFGVPPLPTSVLFRSPEHQFTEEFRFASTFPGPVQFVGGVYFNKSRGGYTQLINSPGLDAASGGAFGTDLVYGGASVTHQDEVAPFGELTYHIATAWSITGGFRYSWITSRSFTYSQGIASDATIPVNLSAKEHAAVPKVAVQYQPSKDLNVYALAAKGYRPGGPQVVPSETFCAADYLASGLTPDDLRTFKSDNLWNYEAGIKSGLFDHKLRLNAAAFWIDWQRIQQTAEFKCGSFFTANAGAARSRGVELQFETSPINHLDLQGGLGYTDAVITKSAPFLSTRVGDPIQNVAPWTAFLSASYYYPISSVLDGYFRVDGNYVGKSHSATNDPINPRVRDPYTLVNLRTGITVHTFELALYVENLGNVHANLGDNNSYSIELPGRPRWMVNPPRTIGLQAIERW
jgi:outer membrane receptor protein involved in Fe transport